MPASPPAKPGGASRQASWTKHVVLWAASTGIVLQSGIRNMLWACAILGSPAVTIGFVYQVVVMHQERLRHEFVANAAEALSRDAAEPDLIDVVLTAPSLADARPNRDLRQSLFATLIAHDRFIDVHGVDPGAMSAAAHQVALSYLKDDGELFQRLRVEKQKDRDSYLFDWRSDEARLHVLHAQLDALVSRTAVGSANPAIPYAPKRR